MDEQIEDLQKRMLGRVDVGVRVLIEGIQAEFSGSIYNGTLGTVIEWLDKGVSNYD